jgi:hypothetical protein
MSDGAGFAADIHSVLQRCNNSIAEKEPAAPNPDIPANNGPNNSAKLHIACISPKTMEFSKKPRSGYWSISD